MMFALEVALFCLIIFLCILCTKSDLTDGLIYNRNLIGFLIPGTVINALYYGIFVSDIFFDFFINFVAVALISLYLFYSHSFAGGDCKMLLVIAFLFPARFYWPIFNSNLSLYLIIAFAIFIGYCYLLVNSIWSIITGKVSLKFGYIKAYISSFLLSYGSALLYISLINQIMIMTCLNNYQISVWIVRLLCLLIALAISKYDILKKKIVFIPSIILLIMISMITRSIPIDLNPDNYIFTLILMFCQMTIKTSIYETVPISSLKKGMILTTFSSMLMQTSITKGLPEISTEDLKSRLTNDEIESIKIWAKATHTDSLTVVKKIPFAIFISAGVFIYSVIWGMLS